MAIAIEIMIIVLITIAFDTEAVTRIRTL